MPIEPSQVQWDQPRQQTRVAVPSVREVVPPQPSPPSGYEATPGGGLRPISGGPADSESVLTPGAITFYAQQVLAGSPMPALGMGKQAATARQLIMAEVARQAGASGLVGGDLARQIAHYKAGSAQLATLEKMAGTIGVNEQAALANGQQFIDRSAELPGQTQYPFINLIVQGVQRNAPVPGHAAVAAMNSAWNTFVTEYAKVVAGSPSGAGVLSDSARREQQDVMRGNYSLDQKRAAFEQMKADMTNRMNAIHAGINDAYAHLTQTPGYAVPDTTAGLPARGDKKEGAGAAPPLVSPPAPGAPPAAGGPPPTEHVAWDQPPSSGQTVASGQARRVQDTRLASQLDAMMNAGAGIEQMNGVVTGAGYQPIPMGDYLAAKEWMKQNPGKAYYGSNPTKDVPLTIMQQVAGSAPGAFAMHGANAFTAGIPAYLAGPQGQAAIDATAATSPLASVAGDLAGSVGAMATGEGAVAGAAPRLAAWAPRITEAGYGAVSGYTGARDDKSRVQDAILGALLMPAAGKAGEAVTKGVGALAKGVTDPALLYLREQGVPLTVGQIAGRGGAVGKGVKKIEDAMTSVPGVGNMVEARRAEGLGAWNRAMFDHAPPPGSNVTAVGPQGVAQVKQAVGKSYDKALGSVSIDANDPAFVNDIGQALAMARSIPDVGGARDAAFGALKHRIGGAVDPQTGQISGRGFQEAYRGLARTARERGANTDYGHEVGQVAQAGKDALAGALERQNPGAFDAFLEANAANRRANVLADAVNRAGNQADNLVTPAQLNRADITSTSRLTGKINAASGNRPFYDLATAGQAVLPSRLPDSGTASRAAIMKALGLFGAGGVGYVGGGQNGAEAGLAGAGALMLGGTRPAQKLLTQLFFEHPEWLVRSGQALERNSRLAGLLTAGATVPALTGP